jgi:dTDP-D-glucose 4,6-dehydratase
MPIMQDSFKPTSAPPFLGGDSFHQLMLTETKSKRGRSIESRFNVDCNQIEEESSWKHGCHTAAGIKQTLNWYNFSID